MITTKVSGYGYLPLNLDTVLTFDLKCGIDLEFKGVNIPRCARFPVDMPTVILQSYVSLALILRFLSVPEQIRVPDASCKQQINIFLRFENNYLAITSQKINI